MEPNRKIEVLIAWDDNTWSTVMVAIPANTPYDKIRDAAEKEAVDFWGRSNTGASLVLAALYSIPEDEEEN